MSLKKRICRILMLSAAVFAGSAMAATQTPLLPLLATDIPAVCGCSFARDGSKGENPILHWANDGKKQAVVRTEGQRHVLELRQEKYMPDRGGNPKPNDRAVVFVANGDWQIQMLGMVTGGSCNIKGRCDLRYHGKLLVQQNGGARTEIPVKGTCGCPKS